MNKAMATTTIAIAAIFISFPIQMSLAMPGAMISVEPSEDLNVTQGDMFMINITIDPAGAEVFGAQYVLHFNNTLLNATGQESGLFLSQGGATTDVCSNDINNTIGRTRYGGTRRGVDYGANSSGVLANITFRALEPGISILNLSSVKLTKNDTKPIPDVLINNGTVEIIRPKPVLFDTEVATNPYPSIFGTYRGLIIPDRNITVNTLYTYPCPGTGGHSENVTIWNETTGDSAEAYWEGYTGDYHNLSFNRTITLKQDVIYNYTIITGSYPQIIHAPEFDATGGKIKCTEFIDANGKKYDDWIVAIKLFFES